MRDHFADCHPAVNLLFFVFAIVMTFLTVHPVILGISLACAAVYCCVLNGAANTGKVCIRFIFPLMLIAAVLNPLCNHYGVTTLCYLWDGNPVTLESLVYGLVMAVMLCAELLWLQCCIKVITTDKWVCLIGKIMPVISLILSMSLRFFPLFVRRGQRIDESRRCMGMEGGSGMRRRLQHAIAVLSILITWSLEKAIITSDSMHARGYGLSGRTSFSLYRMNRTDIAALALLVVPMSSCSVAAVLGFAKASYDPRILLGSLLPFSAQIVLYAAVLWIFLFPVLFSVYVSVRRMQEERTVRESGRVSWRLWEKMPECAEAMQTGAETETT